MFDTNEQGFMQVGNCYSSAHNRFCLKYKVESCLSRPNHGPYLQLADVTCRTKLVENLMPSAVFAGVYCPILFAKYSMSLRNKASKQSITSCFVCPVLSDV